MDNESEVIRQQMEDTRASLVDKLETLEQQVVGTVQGTTSAVTDTVDSVKEGVQETVDQVKQTMQEAVDSVKDTLDVRRQVERHPWMMLGGAIALGYAAGYLFTRFQESNASGAADSYRPYIPPRRESLPAQHFQAPAAEQRPAEQAEEKSWLSGVTDMLGPEIDQLKEMAIGAALGVVRDVIKRSVPPQMEAQITDVADNITTKLGGKPVQGPILDFGSEEKGEFHAGTYHPEMGRPVGSTYR